MLRLSIALGLSAGLLALDPNLAPAFIDIHDTRMLAQPAVSAKHIAFSYADDLWVANRDGTGVRRLTSAPGQEGSARFSPDGKWIAFTGNYDGNLDVYIVSVDGGTPRRLTWHPRPDVVAGFTPDGKQVLFTSSRDSFNNRHSQLFTVPIEGGVETKLPIPSASRACFSPDGTQIAYVPLTEMFRQWKNYRGGTVSRILIYRRSDNGVTQIPQPEGRCNDTMPMWIGDLIYFISDRNGEFNLFSYDTKSKEIKQLTRFTDFPIQYASNGDGKIVFEQAGWLHLFDPSTGKSDRLHVGVAADLREIRPRFVQGGQFVRHATVSPSGSRAAFEFRGEIITIPAEKGDPRNLTQTPGAHERTPSWSPDGKTIAYFSDEGGEYVLHLRPQDGKTPARVVKLGGAGFYENPVWSPDSKKLAYFDNSRSYYILDVASGQSAKIGSESQYGPNELNTMHAAWSPDSQWLAYTLDSKTNIQSVYVYSLKEKKAHRITDGLSDAAEPCFDASGRYLFFLASTDAGPVKQWFAQSSSDMQANSAIYLAVLKKSTPSPLAKESDEEKPKDEAKKDEKKDDGKKAEPKKDEAKKDDDKKDRDLSKIEAEVQKLKEELERKKKELDAKPATPDAAKKEEKKDEKKDEAYIDFDGIEQRILALPVAAGNYRSLQTGPAGQVFFLDIPREQQMTGGSVKKYDLTSRKEETLVSGCVTYQLTPNGQKMLYATMGGAPTIGPLGVTLNLSWFIAPTAAPAAPGKGRLATERLEARIDPGVEWPQILNEVWRINRDYFYDPNMHGANWNAVKEKYAQFLPHLSCRNDLNRVIQWMCSELAVGHSYSGGGDFLENPKTVPVGLLGADYEVAGNRYKFKKVYGGLNWNPELRSPLTAPGVDVKAGEYLLAVRGRDLKVPTNLFSLFEGTVGQAIEITVGPNADGKDSRTVTVEPIGDEGNLRNRDWIEGNLKKVHQATGGRVAYVYVPNTAEPGHTYFKRYFFPQADKDAIIVDERFNGGGQVADYYIDHLRRPLVCHWTTRYGEDQVAPSAAIFGPKAMLIDETAGSGGDLLPWMFRQQKLGKLIGKRTWGGLVGILGYPPLMDGGMVTSPNIAFWNDEGFKVENEGVPADIEVEINPADFIAGRDPQLDKAIEVVMEELKKNPPKKATRPGFPIRVRKDGGGQ